MLSHVLYQFHQQLSALNVTRYITFRTAAASLTALAISLALGPWLVRKLREFQIRPGDPRRRTADASSRRPGRRRWAAAAFSRRRSCRPCCGPTWTNVYVWIAVLTTAGFGAIGFADDYLKIVRRSHHGLRPRYKMGNADRDRHRGRRGAARRCSTTASTARA